MILVGISALFLASLSLAEPVSYHTTPVPILKQINRHNDDGSYSYGYESADGTFKIETKYPSGEVYGKYGYIGDDGKVRQVEYGASKRGFEPVGSHINVAPPTLSNSLEDETNPDYDDGQYREDPSIYEKETTERVLKTAYRVPQSQQQAKYFQPRQFKQQKPSRQQQQQQQSQVARIQYRVQAQPQFRQVPVHVPVQQFRPVAATHFYALQPHFEPVHLTIDPAVFAGHPATNIDINTGSYTVSYTS